MRFYIEGTNKWTEIRMREWNGYGYGADLSNDILSEFSEYFVYTEQEIIDVLEWCAEYCVEHDCQLFVEEGDDDQF